MAVADLTRQLAGRLINAAKASPAFAHAVGAARFLAKLEGDVRCKIGDLAFVVAPAVPSNLGVLVEVLAVWPHRKEAWWVRSLCGPRQRKNGSKADEGMVPDVCLRPLKGDGADQLERPEGEARPSRRQTKRKRREVAHG